MFVQTLIARIANEHQVFVLNTVLEKMFERFAKHPSLRKAHSQLSITIQHDKLSFSKLFPIFVEIVHLSCVCVF